MFAKVTYLKDAVTYIEAEGKLDIYNAPDYLEKVKEYIKLRYTKELVLEFSKITYIASIGLRAILELYNLMQNRRGTLKLKNVNENIMNSIRYTGFDKFLIIENDPEEVEEEQHPEENTDY